MKRAAVVFLLVVGFAQMTGDAVRVIGESLDVPMVQKIGSGVKGLAAATLASPAPKVFSAVRGLETYSTRFFLEWTDRQGVEHSLEITSEIYAKLQGPYNRRNVYGAVLAYGPVLSVDELTKPMFLSACRYALCGKAPVLKEFGIDPESIAGPVRVRFEPLPGSKMGEDLPRVLEVPCP